VRVRTRVDLEHAPDTRAAVSDVEKELGDNGRVLVRPSGTEPLVRIMVEATSQDVADAAAESLRRTVEAELCT
jgi:phosphoglucosamine mutase